ncbi:hypothetical protein E2C01_073566 [Portunus trituberculatus]|uniref:Uncharacterized protein n=1 Tax=Portunus trituberculatus TaxID=210409 RepID=A0A5B7IEA0_PORTR|nr:hypothetical protein [Portunus trituberculatus]
MSGTGVWRGTGWGMERRFTTKYRQKSPHNVLVRCSPPFYSRHSPSAFPVSTPSCLPIAQTAAPYNLYPTYRHNSTQPPLGVSVGPLGPLSKEGVRAPLLSPAVTMIRGRQLG